MPPVVKYYFMTFIGTNLVAEMEVKKDKKIWLLRNVCKLGYYLRRETRGCLFSIYAALHHLSSTNPLAAVRTTDHAVSLTSAWITAKYVCMRFKERRRKRKRKRERMLSILPSETLLNIH
ncbi:hypothetical protein AMECASPLE_024485 [Ameca splendens]|uniref:Uncharacterized protein n=1 Tax=Ameca splendens TaxID=208324 RepID=A0ABV0YG29_9TELE